MGDLRRYNISVERRGAVEAPEGSWVRYEDAVDAIGHEANRAELLAEDIECLHMCLDKAGVPRANAEGTTYSLWGRVMHLKPEQLKPE